MNKTVAWPGFYDMIIQFVNTNQALHRLDSSMCCLPHAVVYARMAAETLLSLPKNLYLREEWQSIQKRHDEVVEWIMPGISFFLWKHSPSWSCNITTTTTNNSLKEVLLLLLLFQQGTKQWSVGKEALSVKPQKWRTLRALQKMMWKAPPSRERVHNHPTASRITCICTA